MTTETGLQIRRGTDIEREIKERIVIYGRAGTGKTRLALSLSARFGKIAYFAVDENSDTLPSIDRRKRDRIYVVSARGENILHNFMKFARTDWKSIDPEINTLVVDTFTKVGQDAIRYSANTGSVTAEKHFKIGDPNEGGQTIPNRGDYMGVDALGRGFIDELYSKQGDMHVILLCHEDVKVVENVSVIGGPAFPGRQMLEYLPGVFGTIIRLTKDQIMVPGASAPTDVVVAIGEGDGKYIAKMRTTNENDPNPLARVVLDRNPETYWTDRYDPIYSPEPVTSK